MVMRFPDLVRGSVPTGPNALLCVHIYASEGLRTVVTFEARVPLPKMAVAFEGAIPLSVLWKQY